LELPASRWGYVLLLQSKIWGKERLAPVMLLLDDKDELRFSATGMIWITVWLNFCRKKGVLPWMWIALCFECDLVYDCMSCVWIIELNVVMLNTRIKQMDNKRCVIKSVQIGVPFMQLLMIARK
jgi:hypothetical protein